MIKINNHIGGFVYLYLIRFEGFSKVGVSLEIDKRLDFYKDKKNIKIYNIKNERVALYIEAKVVNRFNSQTEYIYGYDFNDIKSYIGFCIEYTVVSSYTFPPLNIIMDRNSDGYYDLKIACNYINETRENKGLNKIYVADYLKLKSTKEYMDSLKAFEHNTPFIAKQGAYGTTYAISFVVADFMLWSDVSVKYDVLNWMMNKKDDYSNFLSFHKQKGL